MLEQSHFSEIVCRELDLQTASPDLTEWEQMVEHIHCSKQPVEIGLVGKYTRCTMPISPLPRRCAMPAIPRTPA